MWPWRSCSSASFASDAIRSSSVSPIPTRIPLVNGILSSPAAAIVSIRRAGCLVGDPACTVSISRSETDSSISPWEAVTSRSRARSSRPSTPRFVCGNSPRSSARSHTHTTYDVKSACPYSSRRRGHLRIDLRLLAGQHQQLLHVVARHGAIEQLKDLLRRVQMRPCASRTRSTCSSSGRSAIATA